MPEKHVHKLKRHTYKTGNTVFFCAMPDCSYKTATALALGKRCICWRCGEPFIMNEYSVRLAKPHCEKCHKPKEPLSFNAESQPIEVVMAPIPVNSNSEPKADSVLDLRGRLAGITNHGLMATPDGEDI